MTKTQASVLAVLDRTKHPMNIRDIEAESGETKQKTRNALVKLYQRRDYMVLKAGDGNSWACNRWKISAAGRREVNAWHYALTLVVDPNNA